MWKGNLISCGGNAKTVKGDGSEYLTAIQYLTPYVTLGVNLCSMAELADCIAPCLNVAGRGQMQSVQIGRKRKTLWFINDRDSYMAQLVKDVESFEAYCLKHGPTPCVRLNGTSDIRYELIPVWYKGIKYRNIFAAFPNVTFYDYTKIPNRNIAGINNYSLTWSYSGSNPRYAAMADIAKRKGLNIAVVFRNSDIPKTFLGLPVINGDKDDLRFLDPKGVVVGLYAKGKAKHDKSGFVVDHMEP